MSEVKCSMDYPNPDCNNCPGQFSKEGLCDWPYVLGICPHINDCQKIAAVLDQDLVSDAQYAECMLETCRTCKEKVKV